MGAAWSWKLGEVKGIAIYVHASFPLLLGWVALGQLSAGHDVMGALGAVALVVAVFGTVVLHELGHALTALRFGVRTRDITLYPIGGVARLERMPERPLHELLVAVAGPAVNVAIALVLLAVVVVTDRIPTPKLVDVFLEPFLVKLMWVNVGLAVFNMIPAFPMDGGRVLRAALAMKLDYVSATQAAATVGQAFALLFGLVGLVANPVLVLIAIFVWIGAASEAATAQTRFALGDVPVEALMFRDYRTLCPADRLSHAIEHTLAGLQQDFPVEDGGRLVGFLTRAALLRALADRGRDARVEEVMSRDVPTADPGDMVAPCLAKLHGAGARSCPVVRRDGRLVGILAVENVGDYLTIRQALSRRS